MALVKEAIAVFILIDEFGLFFVFFFFLYFLETGFCYVAQTGL